MKNLFLCKLKKENGRLVAREKGKFVSLSNEDKEFLLSRQDYFKTLKKRIKLYGFKKEMCGRRY